MPPGMTRLNLGLTLGLAAIYLFFSSGPWATRTGAATPPVARAGSAAAAAAPQRGLARPFLWKIEGDRKSTRLNSSH